MATFIMYGTGGHAEHVLEFLEVDGQLVVAEASGKPDRNGTFYTPWHEWWNRTINGMLSSCVDIMRI